MKNRVGRLATGVAVAAGLALVGACVEEPPAPPVATDSPTTTTPLAVEPVIEQWCWEGSYSFTAGHAVGNVPVGRQEFEQQFTALASGQLIRVDLKHTGGTVPRSPIVLSVYEALNGRPTGPALASQGGITSDSQAVDFEQPATLVSGQNYVFVLASTAVAKSDASSVGFAPCDGPEALVLLNGTPSGLGVSLRYRAWIMPS